jgi:hypothetical protein
MKRENADHLLLLSRQVGGNSSSNKNFFERDWSLAWMNFLFQEVGCYAFLPIESFQMRTLGEYRFIYLPHSLAGELKNSFVSSSKSYVESGGTLILEGPVANSLPFSGIRFHPNKDQVFKRISRIEEMFSPHPLKASFSQMPFHTLGWEIQMLPKDTEIILEMENKPVLFESAFGQGAIFSLGFDFGLFLVGLQQGVPAQGQYRLKKLFGTQNRVVEPEDLVLKASLLDNPIPWADLFEKFLFKIITSGRPAPRWWYFPSDYTGAFISTHDEEVVGPDPRLKAMCDTEKSLGIRGNLFVISDCKLDQRWEGDDSLRKWARGQGPEIGLHWNRFQKYRLKIRRFRFGMHEDPLNTQVELLKKEVGRDIRINRTHYLAMGSVYDEHFKSLADEKIFFDSTYGPNQGGRGYLFGTGYPYFGFTWNGANSDVLELPFVTQETWGKADLSFLKQLITESDENFHQCLVMNFHPHYRVLEEKGRGMWLGALNFAKERGQWMPTLGEFFKFCTKRNQSIFHSRWDDSILKVTVESVSADLALSFPYRISESRSLVSVEINGRRENFCKILNGWFEEAFVAIPQGTHEIRVVYET